MEDPQHRGRLLIALAALLWSSSGLFAKAQLFDDWPTPSRGLLLAFWRASFAGLFLAPFVRQARWNTRLAPMVICFTLMNATYLSAMTFTTAANAIWLQSTAPLWIFAAGLLLGREALNPHDLAPLVCGALGIALILAYELGGQAQMGTLFGLMSGACYAGVVISLRGLRAENAIWIVALNHLVAAAVLSIYAVYANQWPSLEQLAVLAAFGVLQMGLPYVLFARGLKLIGSQEASLITLLEPVLMPVWVYLAWGEQPAWWTLVGGGLILAGLVVRYARR